MTAHGIVLRMVYGNLIASGGFSSVNCFRSGSQQIGEAVI